ncbi:hypothetical protein FNV43_RR21144 [Rhamnella rubrinervis]|uniref:Phytocyanin domain-containing protein n=1 Tax=Rhamnella rubrinervis TaxID=2594499 RepID=A0A8K0E7W2_9ROSA|nr:hypothetical protein FNV43_RR21144 [Rhamnella rubrinervis]
MVGLRPQWAVKAIVVIIITSLLFRCVSAATNHSVGGASGWDLTSNIEGWAAETTFFVGDTLVFSYTPVHDVLEVHQLDFHLCHTVHPIHAFNDGETVIKLSRPGPRYFICGRQGHCSLGLRLAVQVLPQLTEDHGGLSPSSAPASSPSHGGGDQEQRRNKPSAVGPSRHASPPKGDRPHPPSPPPRPATGNNATGPSASHPPKHSERGTPPDRGGSYKGAPPPLCTCGAGELVTSLPFWWIPVITTLVIMASSWSPRELGILFGISHLVIA